MSRDNSWKLMHQNLVFKTTQLNWIQWAGIIHKTLYIKNWFPKLCLSVREKSVQNIEWPEQTDINRQPQKTLKFLNKLIHKETYFWSDNCLTQRIFFSTSIFNLTNTYSYLAIIKVYPVRVWRKIAIGHLLKIFC